MTLQRPYMVFIKKNFQGSQSDIAVYSFENKKHISAGSERWNDNNK